MDDLKKLRHAYIVTHKGDGRHAAIVCTLEDAAREAIAGMWAGSLEEALEQEDLLYIYEAIRNPESDEWADYDGEEISFSFEDGSLSVMSIPVKVAAVNALPELIALREENERLRAEPDRAQRACEQMGARITAFENDLREIGAAIINGATDTLWMGDEIHDETIVDFICNRTGDDPSLLGTFARAALKETPNV